MRQHTRPRNEAAPPRRAPANHDGRRKSAIIAVLLIAASLLTFLALVSYDPTDEANADIRLTDLFKVFTGDPEVRVKADTAHNWLGLVGAIISDLLIKSTLGYPVFVLPVILLLFGWKMLRSEDLGGMIRGANYALIGAVLVSATFGMARLMLDAGSLGMEWSGVIGDFLATALAQLLGRAGGAVALITGLLVTAIMGVHLDIRKTAEWLRTAFFWLYDRALALVSSAREEWAERAAARGEAGEGDDDGPSAVSIRKPPAEEPLEEDEAGEDGEVDDAARRKAIAVRRPDPPRPAAPPPATDDVRVEIGKGAPEEGEAVPSGPVVQAAPEEIEYVFPSVELLDAPKPDREEVADEELRANADLLRETLGQFDVQLENISVTPGPVVTLYELVPASGVKISRIVSLENDIALKLAAKGIRIMAPIPGKSAVGVEIPNHHPALVTIRSVINSNRFRESEGRLPLAMGKTIAGEVYTDDLSKMPHVLIAGSTGSGKSVGINTLLCSLLYRLHPSDLKMVIIDPKKIELTQYAKLHNHFLAISPDVDEEIITTPRNAVLALKGVEFEMERRYDRLAAAGVRNISDYNERLKSGRLRATDAMPHVRMPYLIVVIDELADLMITAAREVEEPIARLAQLARAVGIHLIVATQRPSVDVITGVIKANFPARIAYQVASKTDSRTILDMNGAEQLLGNGDMLYLASGSPKPVRLQNAYISPDEVDVLMDHIGKQKGFSRPFMLPSIVERKKGGDGGMGGGHDELFDEAARIIVRHQQGSVSLLQRRLKVGYSRAARLVDELEAAGVVGPFDGSKAREVLVESEAELEVILAKE
jgi:DNA segregation ATPase FtsK/SpoIIIE, S-DNA-T family